MKLTVNFPDNSSLPTQRVPVSDSMTVADLIALINTRFVALLNHAC